MADPVVLSTAAIYFGGYDISGDLNGCRLEARRAELPDSRLGDDIEAFFPGLMSVDLAVQGFYNAGSGGVDGVLAGPRIVSATPNVDAWPLTLAPPYAPSATPGADGNIAYNLRGCQTGYRLGAQHGQSLPFELASRARSGAGVLDRLTVMLEKSTRLATTTGTARQLGALSATQKMVCVLHVFAVTGGTWTLTVESDNAVGFPSPVVRATFTGATDITREVVEVSGAVTDDYWRCVLTKVGGTSCVAAALLGIASL